MVIYVSVIIIIFFLIPKDARCKWVVHRRRVIYSGSLPVDTRLPISFNNAVEMILQISQKRSADRYMSKEPRDLWRTGGAGTI